MKSEHRLLLALDALVNLLLGMVLLLSPAGALEFLGLPLTDTYFYATILGGVIFGIGVALCLDLWGAPRGVRGLGLDGAIAINICGAAVLLFWLVLGRLALPLRGRFVLWTVAVGVLAIGAIEIAARSRR
jgi:hypothetical protein